MQVLLLALLLLLPLTAHAEDLGELSANPLNPESTSNPFGAGSPFKPDGLNNPFSPYGSPFSNQSATNPFATDAPRLYDQQGNYRGKLSANPCMIGPLIRASSKRTGEATGPGGLDSLPAPTPIKSPRVGRSQMGILSQCLMSRIVGSKMHDP